MLPSPLIKLRCSAPGCDNVYMPGSIESFFAFPKEPTRCHKWIHFCGLEDRYKVARDVRATVKLCSKHFNKTECYTNGRRRFLIKTAVPTIHSNGTVLEQKLSGNDTALEQESSETLQAASPTSQSSITLSPLHSPTSQSSITLSPLRSPASQSSLTLSPLRSPASQSSITLSPLHSPASQSSITLSPLRSPASQSSITLSPLRSPASQSSITLSPLRSPASQSSITLSPLRSPASQSSITLSPLHSPPQQHKVLRTYARRVRLGKSTVPSGEKASSVHLQVSHPSAKLPYSPKDFKMELKDTATRYNGDFMMNLKKETLWLDQTSTENDRMAEDYHDKDAEFNKVISFASVFAMKPENITGIYNHRHEMNPKIEIKDEPNMDADLHDEIQDIDFWKDGIDQNFPAAEPPR